MTYTFGQSHDNILLRYNRWELKPKIGLSYQKGCFTELGISLNKYKIGIDTNMFAPFYYCSSEGFYLSCDVLDNFENNILGPKIGYECVVTRPLFSLVIAEEFILYSGMDKTNLVISGNIGISFKYFELKVGYNILNNDKVFEEYIGHYKLSMTSNLNLLFWRKGRKTREEYKTIKNNTPGNL